VAQVQGGTHNSLVVELAEYLVVLDAPIDAAQSRFTIDAAKERYPGKPVRYLVLTHHHMDHTGGARAYVAEGATLVVGAGAGDHFRRALARPDVIASGTAGMSPRPPDIVEVPDRKVLGDGDRTVELLRIENPHAEGMLIGYVSHAKLGFVTDLWSPGRDKLGETLTPGQAAVVAAVTRAGLSPERFAGGHGAVGAYAPLAALATAAAGRR
jgi:glyoxylase-like metal-dependent hydrolase (beta-lactamase superfamily II)